VTAEKKNQFAIFIIFKEDIMEFIDKIKGQKPAEDENKFILSKESAANELKKLFDYYEIDIDEIEDKDLKKAIQQGYDRLIKAVRLGRLKVNIDGGIKVIQTLRGSSETIEYKEIDGTAKTQMDGKARDDYYGKSYALMGSLSGLGEAAIKKLKGVDISLAEVLGLIFLAV
jgi:plasmid stabilization system protein ParE